MEPIDSDKKLLEENLKQAVRDCQKLKVGSQTLTELFTITPHLLLDLTEKKCEDGIHSFKIDSTIKIENRKGENIEKRSDIHFDAQIKGTDVTLLHGLVIADRDFHVTIL